jgi:hypothetical protein
MERGLDAELLTIKCSRALSRITRNLRIPINDREKPAATFQPSTASLNLFIPILIFVFIFLCTAPLKNRTWN